MNVREVLEGLLTEDESVRLNVQVLAPKIERALRAAYRRGVRAVNEEENQLLMTDDDGVTAGVAAMRQES